MLYYSKANIVGSAEDFARECTQILASARRNNGRLGITGVLMVSRRRFAQILEGPAAVLYTTFERIRPNPRHRFVTVLKVAPATDRTFGSWAMALAGSAPGSAIPLSVEATLDSVIADPARAGVTLIPQLLNLVQSSHTPTKERAAA